MKLFCGVFQDGSEIKIACLHKQGKKFIVEKLLSVPSKELKFILDSSTLSNPSDELEIELNDIEDLSQPKTHLSKIIESYPLEKLKFVPVITEPHISYIVFNPDKPIKNTDLKNELSKLWNEISNVGIDKEKIDFIEYKNHSYISTILADDIPILNELKELSLISETKSLEVLPVRSGDLSLINYVFRFYQPGKNENYLVIYVGVDSIRLIFIKDQKVVHINRYLGLNFERQGLVGFISSKIVLEMEYAGITEISNIILTGEVNDDFYSAFAQSFPFTKIELLNLQFFDITQLSDEDKIKIQSFSLPLVAIYDSVFPFKDIRKNLEVHTRRVSKISLVKKIDFISFALFLILSSIIFYSFSVYLDHSKKLKELQIQNSRLTSLQTQNIEDLQKIDELSHQFEVLNNYLAKINEFKSDQISWVDQFITINTFNPRKNKIWLTSINVDDQIPEKMILKGLAVERGKIPEFMKVLKEPELKNIYLYEIRGKKIFQFELVASLR